MPKVSVIVPVYNVSSYLDKCLDSVENSTLEDIEIIVVNDCSPDPLDDVICQQHADNDRRIIYVQHTENLGTGGARNTGLKLASADYVGFVDSDDFIDPEMFEVCYTEAIKDDNDIVNVGFILVNEEAKEIGRGYTVVEHEGDRLLSFLQVAKGCINPASWNKLYKRSLFKDNNIEFPLYIYYEDLITTAKLLYFAENVKFLDRALYYYLQREGSIIKSYSKQHIDSAFESLSILIEFTRSIGKSDFYKSSLQDRFWSIIEYQLTGNRAHPPETDKEEIHRYLRDRVVSSDLVDLRYFFSRKDYLVCDVLFKGLPKFIESTQDIQSLFWLRKSHDELKRSQDKLQWSHGEIKKKYEKIAQSRDGLRKKYEEVRNNRWYKFGQLTYTQKAIFIPKYLLKKVKKVGVRLTA